MCMKYYKYFNVLNRNTNKKSQAELIKTKILVFGERHPFKNGLRELK